MRVRHGRGRPARRPSRGRDRSTGGRRCRSRGRRRRSEVTTETPEGRSAVGMGDQEPSGSLARNGPASPRPGFQPSAAAHSISRSTSSAVATAFRLRTSDPPSVDLAETPCLRGSEPSAGRGGGHARIFDRSALCSRAPAIRLRAARAPWLLDRHRRQLEQVAGGGAARGHPCGRWRRAPPGRRAGARRRRRGGDAPRPPRRG